MSPMWSRRFSEEGGRQNEEAGENQRRGDDRSRGGSDASAGRWPGATEYGLPPDAGKTQEKILSLSLQKERSPANNLT